MFYSLPSNPVIITPQVSGYSAFVPEASLTLRAYNFVLGSPTILSWIQSFNPLGTIAGRVFLGYSLQELQMESDLLSNGPRIFIRYENENFVLPGNAGPDAFLGTCDVVIEFEWGINYLAPQTYMNELNYLGNIRRELSDQGKFWSQDGFNTQLLGFGAVNDAFMGDTNSEVVRRHEMRLPFRCYLDGNPKGTSPVF